MANLQLKNIFKVYEGGVRAVSDFNLEIQDKEFVVFVGPSGCGKSTTLRMIAGLEEITAGELYIDGARMNDVQPKDRNIAMVFQNYALYPHMSVFQNMAFGLKLRKLPQAEIEEKVKNAASILGISELLTRKPKALSGGQRQRVALGRAIVREPNVFLFDEPLSNLDAKLRVQMRTEITKLHKRLATTFIYVTHDQTEAMTMGDRIVVMKDGFIQQVDTPATLYSHPSNVFVATFLGSPQMNIFPATISVGKELSVQFGENHVVKFPQEKTRQLAPNVQSGSQVIFGIRPENISLGQEGVPATVDVVEHLGSQTIIYAKIDGLNDSIILTVPTNYSVVSNMSVNLVFDMQFAHMFDATSQQSILGVPTVNTFPCTLNNNVISTEQGAVTLPQTLLDKLFYNAQEQCTSVEIVSDKISLTEKPDCLQIEGKVLYVEKGNDHVSLFVSCPFGKQMGFRCCNDDLKVGDAVTLYVPYSAISLRNAQGMRLNCREDIKSNSATAKVKTTNGVTHIVVGGTQLSYPDMQIADGDYTLTLKSDKLSFNYDKKYARKNKLTAEVKSNALGAKAYDEDQLNGGKNAVFVQIAGFEDYVTAILDDVFSVYKMPDFKIVVPAEAVELQPIEKNS